MKRSHRNDIAEDIDNGESREVLRESLAIYADFLWDSNQFKGETLLEKTLSALQALERTQSQNRKDSRQGQRQGGQE